MRGFDFTAKKIVYDFVGTSFMDTDFRNYSIIELRAGTDNWGLFTFDFTDSIPSDSTVTNVTISAYAGRISPRDAELSDLGVFEFPGQTAVTIVDSDYVPTITDNVVSVKLIYPGDAYKGRATLVFLIEIDGGGLFPFFFSRVIIK